MLQPAHLREFAESGLVTAERMRVIDRNAIALGLSSLQMMESAGRSLAAVAAERNAANILILCGRGNNGGDGMAAARYLQYCTVSVILDDSGPATPETTEQRSLLSVSATDVYPVRCRDDLLALRHLFSGSDVIIDALLGTGVHGALREPLVTAVTLAQESGAPIISADVPTPGITPQVICAFHRPKTEGSRVIDIGIPLAAEVFTGPGELTLVPKRDPKAHKGAGGKVLVIGGGPFQGAPYLTGLGALRAGADIVRIASPAFEPIPDLIYSPLSGDHISEEHVEEILSLVKTADVVVIGNGLGEKSHGAVLAIALQCRKAVFDADALRQPLPTAPSCIYTPHAGEFARMTGIHATDDPAERGRTARDAGIPGTILLKGPVDVVTDGTRVRFSATGTPAMTVGGTGDVLAGVCGAMLCHLPPFEAACVAAWVNGRAGTRVEREKGGGILASDLAVEIPKILFGGM
ncbi:MAG: NAD(P)H-hydrate dehydratase [Methanomicrobiales archaeon]|nr:NAD(P)H-hydrate dehydratase [Methanomicrobiales archaeon]